MAIAARALALARSLIPWRRSAPRQPPALPPPARTPQGDARDHARATVEKIRTAYLAGRFHLLPWLDRYTEETPEMRAHYPVMLREPTLQASLLGQVSAVASQDCQVHPENPDDPREAAAAKAALHALRKVHGGSPWLPMGLGPRHIAWSVLSGAVLKGWSLSEVTLRKYPERQGPAKDKVIWETFKAKDTESVQLVTDRYWGITGVKAMRFNPGVLFEGADLHSFVVFNRLSFYEYPIGTSAFRAAYRAYWIKDTVHQLRALHLDRFTTPFLRGQYATADQRPLLEEALEEARASTWISVPVGCLVDAIDVAGRGTADYEKAIESCDKEMLTAVCGAFLHMMTSASNDRGDSEVQKETTELFQWALSAALGDTITLQMLKPWYAYNYHDMEPGTATWGAVSEKALQARANLDKVLKDIGMELSAKEAYAYYSRQRPAGKDDVLGGDKGGEGGGAPPGPGGGPPGGPGGGGGPDEGGGDQPDQGGSGGDAWSGFGELPQHWHAPWEDLSSFAEADWIEWTIKAGPRKGQSVWKNTNTGKLSDTKPGAKKEPTAGKGKTVTKPPPAGKPAKLTVDAAHDHIKQLLASPPADMGAAVKDVATRLQELTVKDLGELKARLGLKASGNKAELAQKLAERALAGGGATKPPVKPPPPPTKKVEKVKPPPATKKPLPPPVEKPPAVDEPQTWEAFRRAYRDADKVSRRGGELIKLPNLYDAVAKEVPGLDREGFHGLLQKWEKQDKLTLQSVNDPHMEPRAGEMLRHPSRGLLGYVDLRPEHELPSEETKPGRPEPKPPDPLFTGTDTLGRKWVNGKLVPGEPEPIKAKHTGEVEVTPGRRFDLSRLMEGGQKARAFTDQEQADLKTLRLDGWMTSLNDYDVTQHPEEVKRLQAAGILEPMYNWGKSKGGPQKMTRAGHVARALLRMGGRGSADPTSVNGIRAWDRLYGALEGDMAARQAILDHFGITKPVDDYESFNLSEDLTAAATMHHNGGRSIAQRVREAKELHATVSSLATATGGAQEARDGLKQREKLLETQLPASIASGLHMLDYGIPSAERWLAQPGFRRPGGKAALRADLEKAKAIKKQYEKIIEERHALNEKLYGNRAAHHEAVSAILRAGVKDPAEVRITIGPDSGPNATSAMNKAIGLLKGVLARSTTGEDWPEMTTYIDPGNNRGHYSEGKINLPETEGELKAPTSVRLCIHETLHGIEQNDPGIAAAIQEFRRYRIGDEQGRDLEDFGMAGEIGYKDHFGLIFPDRESSAYYTGKSYGSDTTEILTMLGQQLWVDPEGLARRDPEACAFVVGILNGTLRSKPIPLEDEELMVDVGEDQGRDDEPIDLSGLL